MGNDGMMKRTSKPIQLSENAQRLLADTIRELRREGRLDEEKMAMQHGTTSIYRHSLRVAYTSLWLMERWQLHLEARTLVRGALLHDYFLYDWHQKDLSHRLHGFRHPKTALGNAEQDYYLNWKEKNIIARHMFPLLPLPRRCREAWLVCLADKWCALGETVEPMFHVKHFK